MLAEQDLRDELRKGDVAGAVTRAVALYGAEVFGFLTAAIGSLGPARDVYASFVTELGRALPAFEWRYELRTLAYLVARRELRRHRERTPGVERSCVRRSTRRLGRSRHSSRRGMVAALRRGLAPEDRELLVLRVDRGLSWQELALTSLGEHASDSDLDTEADHLQRRFLRLRLRIARLVRRPAGPRPFHNQ